MEGRVGIQNSLDEIHSQIKSPLEKQKSRLHPSELGKTLNTLWNLVEHSPLSSTYANTLPVNQQILPSILIRLNQFPGKYPNKLVIPIRLFPINLHFMGVLTLLHLNLLREFSVYDFSSTFPINRGYRIHSIDGICLKKMLVFKAFLDISKCGYWMAKCLTGSEESQPLSPVPMNGSPIAFMDSRLIFPKYLTASQRPSHFLHRADLSSWKSLQLYAYKENITIYSLLFRAQHSVQRMLNLNFSYINTSPPSFSQA